MPHDLSLGEIQALALKAARGVGRAHGIAEEAAFAVRWLTERGHDGAGHLAALLRDSDGATAGCPLHLGAALSDLGRFPEVGPGAVLCPMLLVPFLEGLCGEGAGLSLSAGASVIQVSGRGDLAGVALPTGWAAVEVRRCHPPNASPRRTRALVAEVAMATLTEFAQRTYAPATEASRASGAGAGLSDND